MERQLSNAAIIELDKDHEDRQELYLRAVARRKKLRGVNDRKSGDRRVAINSFCDPAMERRSGYDRRR